MVFNLYIYSCRRLTKKTHTHTTRYISCYCSAHKFHSLTSKYISGKKLIAVNASSYKTPHSTLFVYLQATTLSFTSIWHSLRISSAFGNTSGSANTRARKSAFVFIDFYCFPCLLRILLYFRFIQCFFLSSAHTLC